jgi:hypothetical protein
MGIYKTTSDDGIYKTASDDGIYKTASDDGIYIDTYMEECYNSDTK